MIQPSKLRIYVEPRDAWVGVYDDNDTVYVCPLPWVVICYHGDPWYAGVLLASTSWTIAGMWASGWVPVPAWLIGVGVYLLALSVLAGVLMVRRTRRRAGVVADDGADIQRCEAPRPNPSPVARSSRYVPPPPTGRINMLVEVGGLVHAFETTPSNAAVWCAAYARAAGDGMRVASPAGMFFWPWPEVQSVQMVARPPAGESL